MHWRSGKSPRPGAPRRGQSLNNLARVYDDQGQYTKAEPLYQASASDPAKRPWARSTPRWPTSLNNLAALYCDQGQYAKAEPLHKRALAIWERLGLEHPDRGGGLDNLAQLYAGQGRYAKAEASLTGGRWRSGRGLGPEHPNVATSLNNLAGFTTPKANTRRPSHFYRRALKIREKAWARSTPKRPRALRNLGGALRQPRPIREGRAPLRAGAGDPGKGPGPGAPRRGRRASTTWRCFTQAKANTRRPSRFSERALAI